MIMLHFILRHRINVNTRNKCSCDRCDILSGQATLYIIHVYTVTRTRYHVLFHIDMCATAVHVQANRPHVAT